MLLQKVNKLIQPYLAFCFASLFALNFVISQTLHHHELIQDNNSTCEYCLVKSFEYDSIQLELSPQVYFLTANSIEFVASEIQVLNNDLLRLRGPPSL